MAINNFMCTWNSGSKQGFMLGATAVIAGLAFIDGLTGNSITNAAWDVNRAVVGLFSQSNSNNEGNSATPAVPGASSPPSPGMEPDNNNDKKSGETSHTKLGREEHKKWDPGKGFQKEVKLDSGKRADAVNFVDKIVKELKPENARAIRQGLKQLDAYKKELESMTKEIWKSVLETYKKP